MTAAAAAAWRGDARRGYAPASSVRVLWAGEVPRFAQDGSSVVVLEEAGTPGGAAVATVEEDGRLRRLLTVALLPPRPPLVLAFRGGGMLTCDHPPCVYNADVSEAPLVVLAAPGVRSVAWAGSVGLMEDRRSGTAVDRGSRFGVISTNESVPTSLTVTGGAGAVSAVLSGCDMSASTLSPVPDAGACP